MAKFSYTFEFIRFHVDGYFRPRLPLSPLPTFINVFHGETFNALTKYLLLLSKLRGHYIFNVVTTTYIYIALQRVIIHIFYAKSIFQVINELLAMSTES